MAGDEVGPLSISRIRQPHRRIQMPISSRLEPDWLHACPQVAKFGGLIPTLNLDLSIERPPNARRNPPVYSWCVTSGVYQRGSQYAKRYSVAVEVRAMLSVSILRHLAGMMRLRIVCAGIMQQLDSSNDRAGGQFRRLAKDDVATPFAQASRDGIFPSTATRRRPPYRLHGVPYWPPVLVPDGKSWHN